MHFSIQIVVFVVTFILALMAGPILIPILRRLKFGQTVRDDGPSTHLKKTGTPTIGGLIFLIPVIMVSIVFASVYPEMIPLAIALGGFGIIGFIDDFIKVVRKRKDGLYPKQKTVGLLIVAAVFSFYIAYFTDIGTDIDIPLIGTVDEVWFFILFTIVFLYCVTNAVNITDGLDGLCAGITLIVMVFFTLIAMTNQEYGFINVFSSSVAGGCLGFLTFNTHPARVFMGDTGSLALGGAVGAILVMMKMPFIIFLIGIVYVVEMLSVAIQVISFKARGKRVFKMAPIHHHFELCGWKETRVVYTFWTVTIIGCLTGLLVLGVRFF
jgi:phospho-N-acetylmuramoyl-pentapeptide-transferase